MINIYELKKNRNLKFKLILIFVFFSIQVSLFSINIDSLEKVVLNVQDKSKSEIYNTLAKAYQNNSSEKSIYYANLALKYSQQNYDKINESLAYFTLGYNYVSLNNLTEAKKNFQKSLDIRLVIGDRMLIATSYNAMGNVVRLTGNNQLALDYYFKALEIRKAIGDKLLIAATNNNIGIIYKYWGNYEKALEFYFQTLNYAEMLKDSTIIMPALINIGNLYSDLKKYNKALEYYFKVLEIAKKTDNLAEVASVYNSIGTSYNAMNDLEKSVKYFNDSYLLAKQIGNVISQSNALNNLGEAYHRKNEFDKALEYYSLSAKLSSKSDDLNSYATSMNNIGSIYRSKNEFTKSLPYLLKSLEINTKHENLHNLKENYINLAKVYEGLGNFKKAYFFHCQFSDLNDSLSSETMNKKFFDLQFKFDSEKKEKEIELLKNEKRIEEGKKNYLYALLFLGSLLVIVIFILFLIKLRANRLLTEKNSLISEQKNKLSDTLAELNIINASNEKYLKIITDELSRASDYVISLLPSEIKEGNIRTEWMLKPSSKLGGDTLGYHWLDDDNFAMYLLDVSGHGVGVSLHSISIFNTIKFQTLDNTDFKCPEKVLSSLNNAYQMLQHNKLFFTIWYGVFNKSSRELKFASAGHPPAILIDKSNDITLLGTKNYVIGGNRKFDYSSNSIVIQPSSKIFIFSDGVYEIQDKDGNFWSIDELKAYLKIQANETENELKNLYDFVVKYNDNETLDDDFSIIKIEID